MNALVATWLGAILASPAAHALDVSPPVQEVSAAVLDRTNGVIWTLGDSGTAPVLGRTYVDTSKTELVKISGAENIDWEALVLDDAGTLWILDVGDNEARRPNVTLYSVAAATASILPEVRAERRIRVSYPDGAMDVEAGISAGPSIFLFEKKRVGLARIMAVDVSPGSARIQTARPAGKTTVIGAITDASISPEGDLFLLTYLGVYRAAWPDDDRRWRVTPFRMGFWGQVEALIALGRSRLLVSAEDGRFFEP